MCTEPNTVFMAGAAVSGVHAAVYGHPDYRRGVRRGVPQGCTRRGVPGE